MHRQVFKPGFQDISSGLTKAKTRDLPEETPRQYNRHGGVGRSYCIYCIIHAIASPVSSNTIGMLQHSRRTLSNIVTRSEAPVSGEEIQVDLLNLFVSAFVDLFAIYYASYAALRVCRFCHSLS